MIIATKPPIEPPRRVFIMIFDGLFIPPNLAIVVPEAALKKSQHIHRIKVPETIFGIELGLNDSRVY